MNNKVRKQQYIPNLPENILKLHGIVVSMVKE